LLFWRFLKVDGGVNYRLQALCELLGKYMSLDSVPPPETATFLRAMFDHCQYLEKSFQGPRTPWIEAASKAGRRLSELFSAFGRCAVAKVLGKEGCAQQDASALLDGLNQFSYLPSGLQVCQQILSNFGALKKLIDAPVPEDLADLGKEMGNVATLSSYDMNLLKEILPESFAKSIDGYFGAVYESMNVSLAQVDSEMAQWREILAKYRPGQRVCFSACFDLVTVLSLALH
jgi:hypothetical protein